jgi:GTP-binding protein
VEGDDVPGPLPFRFVTSADRVDRLPPSPAEVAVVGRSNVGKSSLLNAVAARTGLAKVSKTPGRTQLLNCFELERGPGAGGTLVDCPGYGYAATSKAMRRAWAGMIETYLREREPLAMVLVLVDGEVGPTKLDVQMLEWLRAEALPHTVVATKVDKVRSTQRPRRRRDLAAGCQLEPGDVVWTSAAKGIGVDELRRLVTLWLST